jgi:hypothetical protein
MPEHLAEIEAAQQVVGVDLDLVAIRLEVVDPRGDGFACLLGASEALDLALRLIGGLMRLRRLDRGETEHG